MINIDTQETGKPGFPESGEQGKQTYPDLLARIKQQPPLKAIKVYKQLLKTWNPGIRKHYEEIILNLCKLLTRCGLYGEELYYRLSIRYYTESMLTVHPEFLREDKIVTAMEKLTAELKANCNALNVLIIDSDLESCRLMIEVIKTTCCQQVYIFPGLESLLQVHAGFMDNFQLSVFCNQNRDEAVKMVSVFKEKFPGPPLFALYCASGDYAGIIFREHNNVVDYILYNEVMVYAVLHMALKRQRGVS